MSEASVILYMHGGGYVIGSAGAYLNFVGHIPSVPVPRRSWPTTHSPRSDHSPAAVNDFQALHKGLLTLGYERIALVGDSAGAGLTLSSVAEGIAKFGKIVGVVAMSP